MAWRRRRKLGSLRDVLAGFGLWEEGRAVRTERRGGRGLGGGGEKREHKGGGASGGWEAEAAAASAPDGGREEAAVA